MRKVSSLIHQIRSFLQLPLRFAVPGLYITKRRGQIARGRDVRLRPHTFHADGEHKKLLMDCTDYTNLALCTNAMDRNQERGEVVDIWYWHLL